MSATRLRTLRAALVVWAGASAALALQPPGVGGAWRAIDAALFMLLGPALAGVLAWRARSGTRNPMTAVPPLVELLVGVAGWIAILVMVSTALLVAAAWSVPVMVLGVAAATLTLTLWPVPGEVGRRSDVPRRR